MSIVLVRIDDRLIHGQVIEGWARALRIEHIVVASDWIAGDPFQRKLLELAVPGYIRITISTIANTRAMILKKEFEKERTMLLLSSPAEALDLVRNGVNLPSINIGGLHYRPGKKQVLRAISLDERDIESLKLLDHLGVELEARILPSDERLDLIRLLNKLEKQNG